MLTPEEIYKNYTKKSIDKTSAVENLISIIENSDNLNTRVESIEIFEKIKIKNKIIFYLLENLLISDSHEKIRIAAATVIKHNYLDRALDLMKWVLLHEDSPNCLKIIYETLISIIKNLEKENSLNSKSILIEEIKKINHNDFNTLHLSRRIESISKKELSDILINYFTIAFLEKVFWRLKYEISNCTVVTLNFIFKGLTKLPKAIANLSSLKRLILRYNQLTSIPDWLGSINSLDYLNLNVNDINKIPETIGSLSFLKELHLWNNKIYTLPNSITTIKSLGILNLRLNRLEILPENIGNMISLRELNLHDNRLTSTPESIGSLRNLEKLNLSWNELTSIPKSIGSLISLKTLDLSRNNLDIIPDSIGALQSLEILNLSENKLLELPETLGDLPSLKILNLSRNNLQTLPKSLLGLLSLKELYLGDNSIKKYPKALKELENNDVLIFY